MKTDIYLNNAASCYPRPASVNKIIIDCLNTPPYHPGRAGLDSAQQDFVSSCRYHLAALFNAANPSDIILNSGATESLNTVIQGLVSEHSHVITTAIEHNSVLRPLYRLAREKGIALTILECDHNGTVQPEQFAKAIQDNTSLIVMSHCSNVTGAVQDIASVSRIAHQSNAAFMVDGSQSAGLYDIDVMRDEIDVLVFAGHKYLYGLPGTGGFYLNPNLSLRPLKVGGTGIRSDLTEQPPERPILFEAGTANMIGIAALDAGVRYVLEQGTPRIQDHIGGLVRRLCTALDAAEGVTVYAREVAENSSMLAFNITDMTPEETSYLLENSFGMITRP